MPEHDALPVGDAVDRALAAGRELHDEQVGAALVGQQLERLLEPHRRREPGRSCSSWCARSTVGSRMRKPRDPDENTGLKQTGRSGIAELARRGLDLARTGDAAELDGGDADPLQQRVRLRLVVRAVHRVRRRDEHRDGEAVAHLGERLQVERRLRQRRRRRSPARRARGSRRRSPGRSPAARRGTRRRGSGRSRSRSCRCRRCRTQRSPFSRSARSRRALPGAPEALTRTVVMRGRSGRSASCASQLVVLRVEHRVHRLPHRRAVVDPDLRVHEQLQPRRTRRRAARRAGSLRASAGSSRSGTCPS